MNKKDELMIDYMEKDLDPNLQKDVELLLRHSAEDRVILNNLEKVKNNLKNMESKEDEFDEVFFKNMHDKIMKKVEQTEIQPAQNEKIKIPKWYGETFKKYYWRGTMLATLGLSLSIMSYQSISHFRQNIPQEISTIVQMSAQSPEAFSQSVIGYQTESDFFMDVVQENIEDLSQEKYNEIIKSMIN